MRLSLSRRRGFREVIAEGLDSSIAVNEFELQSRYNIPFLTNKPQKGMNLFILLDNE